jgi:hypothetical protein
MARQVIEDTLSFLYLSEPGLTPEEKQFREFVWHYHGSTEALRSATFAFASNPDLPSAAASQEELGRKFQHYQSRLDAIEGGRRGRIRKGEVNHVLHDHEILERRGIRIDAHRLPHKVLSNFAHFSTLSHAMIMQSGGKWETSWQSFMFPVHFVPGFVAEAIGAFLEISPEARQLLDDEEQGLVAHYRTWLRTNPQV